MLRRGRIQIMAHTLFNLSNTFGRPTTVDNKQTVTAKILIRYLIKNKQRMDFRLKLYNNICKIITIIIVVVFVCFNPLCNPRPGSMCL